MSIDTMKKMMAALNRIRDYGNVFAYKGYEQSPYEQINEAIAAGRAAIEAAERQQDPSVDRMNAYVKHIAADKVEPVAWLRHDNPGGHDQEIMSYEGHPQAYPVFTAPQPAPAWQPIDVPLHYKTRCADGTIFLNAVQMPAHAVEWCITAAPKEMK